MGTTFWKAKGLLVVWLGQANSQLWLLGEAEEMVDSHGEYEVLILRWTGNREGGVSIGEN